MDLNHPSNFQSEEEKYFYWYLEELKKHGYVTTYRYQPKPFPLSYPVYHEWIKQLKTKQKLCKSTLLQSHEYQADFIIYWTNKAHFVFHTAHTDSAKLETPFVSNKSGLDLDKYFSIVDIKGTYDQQDNTRRFSISQKWVWKKFKIFVQKIVPVPKIDKNGKLIPANALFPTTFVPKRYFLTDRSMAKRKIRFPNRSIENFITNKK